MCTPHYGTSVVLLKPSQALLPYEGQVLSLLSQEKLRRGGQRDSHKSTWLARGRGGPGGDVFQLAGQDLGRVSGRL